MRKNAEKIDLNFHRTGTLMDRFGPDNFSTLQIKGHVFHRARAHLKVPG